MKKWKVTILPDAETDIDELYVYIAKVLMEPVAAANLVVRIKKAIRSLEYMPERHRLYYDEPWHSKGLRVFPVGNFIVFFHIDIDTVFIDSVLYGGRDIELILGDRMPG